VQRRDAVKEIGRFYTRQEKTLKCSAFRGGGLQPRQPPAAYAPEGHPTLVYIQIMSYAVMLLKLHYAVSSGPGFKIWLLVSKPHGAFVAILATATASSYKA